MSIQGFAWPYGLMLVGWAASMLLPGSVWAGKPSGTDKVPPAQIALSSLSVKTSARALTLRFTASGDDGTSGTAALYDVVYRDRDPIPDDLDNCSNDPDTWTRALRSDVTIPEPAGTVDYFNVRPLAADQDYCLAIRVRDEVPTHWSAWTPIAGKTTGASDEWRFDATQPASPDQPTNGTFGATKIHLALTADGQPVLGWSLYEHTNTCCTQNQVVFEGNGWQKQVLLTEIDSVSSFRMTTNPDSAAPPMVAAVVTNNKPSTSGGGGKNAVTNAVNSYWLVEVEAGMGPESAKVSPIASGKPATGGIDNLWGSSITYVSNGATWHPVTTVEHVEWKASDVKRTSLRLAERVDPVNNTWEDTTVLLHEGPDQVNGFFMYAEAFTKPDGTTLGLVTAHCGVTIYAQRVDGTWEWYDAGPSRFDYRVSFDPTTPDPWHGQASAVILSQTGSGAGQAVISRQANFRPLGDMPAATCANVAPSAVAWEVVNLPVDPDVPYLYLSGIAEFHGATFISATQEEGNEKTAEQRLVYNCRTPDDSAWHVMTIDRTNSARTKAQPIVVDTAGNILQAYSWGTFARFSGNGPAYSDWPMDYVYLASRGGNPCNVFP